MHSQDDVMWSRSYHKKLLSGHGLSAYKIWTTLDNWFLRYQIMKNSDCAHAHYGCLATFIIKNRQRTLVRTTVQYNTIPFKRHLYLQINTFWTLVLICIIKMTSYDLVLFIWNDCLVMMYLQTKFGRIRISGYWDIKQRVIQFVRMRTMSILRDL